MSSKQVTLKVSLISSIYRDSCLEQILDSYRLQSVADYEVIIVVSNQSINIANQITRYLTRHNLLWQVHYMPGLSNCKSRNFGTSIANNEVLIFVDGDQIVDKSLVQEHLKIHNQYERLLGMGLCNIDVAPNLQVITDLVKSLDVDTAFKLARMHNIVNYDDYINTVGRNVSIKKQHMAEMGGWDEELEYSPTTKDRGWEDTEFGIRAFEKKFEIKIVPAWTVHIDHEGMAKNGGRDNVIKMIQKHPWFIDDRPDWFKLHKYDIDMVRIGPRLEILKKLYDKDRVKVQVDDSIKPKLLKDINLRWLATDCINVMNLSKLKWWASAGTILGFVREPNQFIDHDTDIDIEILYEPGAEDILKKLFLELGYKIYRTMSMDNVQAQMCFISSDGGLIDVYMYYQDHGFSYNFNECGILIMPDKFINPTNTMTAFRNTFSVPQDIENYLIFRFGANWRTPIKYEGGWGVNIGEALVKP